MKKLLFLFPCLIGLFIGMASCDHDYDELYEDEYYDDYNYHEHHEHGPYYFHDEYYHHDVDNIYNYIRGGRWYYVSTHGDLHGYYDTYIVFNDWEILHYDRDHHMYDRGTYKYHDGCIHIHYDNGDVVDYWINKAFDNELILRSKSGIEYRYVRR